MSSEEKAKCPRCEYFVPVHGPWTKEQYRKSAALCDEHNEQRMKLANMCIIDRKTANNKYMVLQQENEDIRGPEAFVWTKDIKKAMWFEERLVYLTLDIIQNDFPEDTIEEYSISDEFVYDLRFGDFDYEKLVWGFVVSKIIKN